MSDLMLVSQSNSGSTWFYRCLRKAHESQLRGPMKEYFNPLLNERYRLYLERVLGSEHFPSVKNLAKSRTQAEIDEVVETTWKTEDGYNLTKENYLAFQLPQFAKHFDLVFFFRDIEYCFPPERNRVMCWYDSWLWSLVENRKLCPALMRLDPLTLPIEVRAVMGWQVVRWQLEVVARRTGSRCYYYRKLVDASNDLKDVEEPLRSVLLSTRKHPEKPSTKFMEQWSGALAFHKVLLAAYAQEQVALLEELYEA